MLYFITEGNNVRIKDGDNDFRVLHNTSNCINWTVYTDKIDLSIDEVTFDQMNPTHIYFDGVAASNSAGVVNSLKGMFSNLGSKAKVYRALLTQTSSNSPTAIIKELSLNYTPELSRLEVGVFLIDIIEQDDFYSPKCIVKMNNMPYQYTQISHAFNDTGTGILFYSYNTISGSPVLADNRMENVEIEILVYP